jgi:hypothetical protein
LRVIAVVLGDGGETRNADGLFKSMISYIYIVIGRINRQSIKLFLQDMQLAAEVLNGVGELIRER